MIDGTISTPTTSADMKPLIDIGNRRGDHVIPLRNVRGNFGPLSVEDVRNSESELGKNSRNRVRVFKKF